MSILQAFMMAILLALLSTVLVSGTENEEVVFENRIEKGIMNEKVKSGHIRSRRLQGGR